MAVPTNAAAVAARTTGDAAELGEGHPRAIPASDHHSGERAVSSACDTSMLSLVASIAVLLRSVPLPAISTSTEESILRRALEVHSALQLLHELTCYETDTFDATTSSSSAPAFGSSAVATVTGTTSGLPDVSLLNGIAALSLSRRSSGSNLLHELPLGPAVDAEVEGARVAAAMGRTGVAADLLSMALFCCDVIDAMHCDRCETTASASGHAILADTAGPASHCRCLRAHSISRSAQRYDRLHLQQRVATIISQLYAIFEAQRDIIRSEVLLQYYLLRPLTMQERVNWTCKLLDSANAHGRPSLSVIRHGLTALHCLDVQLNGLPVHQDSELTLWLGSEHCLSTLRLAPNNGRAIFIAQVLLALIPVIFYSSLGQRIPQLTSGILHAVRQLGFTPPAAIAFTCAASIFGLQEDFRTAGRVLQLSMQTVRIAMAYTREHSEVNRETVLLAESAYAVSQPCGWTLRASSRLALSTALQVQQHLSFRVSTCIEGLDISMWSCRTLSQALCDVDKVYSSAHKWSSDYLLETCTQWRAVVRALQAQQTTEIDAASAWCREEVDHQVSRIMIMRTLCRAYYDVLMNSICASTITHLQAARVAASESLKHMHLWGQIAFLLPLSVVRSHARTASLLDVHAKSGAIADELADQVMGRWHEPAASGSSQEPLQQQRHRPPPTAVPTAVATATSSVAPALVETHLALPSAARWFGFHSVLLDQPAQLVAFLRSFDVLAPVFSQPQVLACFHTLQLLAEYNPIVWLHKLQLLAAECLRTVLLHQSALEHYLLVLSLYDAAIASATHSLVVPEEALANEYCGRFLLQLQRKAEAGRFLRRALACYHQWQAWHKVREMSAEFPVYFRERSTGM